MRRRSLRAIQSELSAEKFDDGTDAYIVREAVERLAVWDDLDRWQLRLEFLRAMVRNEERQLDHERGRVARQAGSEPA